MTSFSLIILYMFYMASSSHPQCLKEHFEEADFSIQVKDHIKMMYLDCWTLKYQLTYPENIVTVPYNKIWFNGDPANTVSVKNVVAVEPTKTDTLVLKDLTIGEHEFGFKLEWGCNQSYVFPKRVRISVSEMTRRPAILITNPMVEGETASLHCLAFLLCSKVAKIQWKLPIGNITEAESTDLFLSGMNIINITPKADDDNSKVTCEAHYGDKILERTVTLRVNYSPKILKVSQCVAEGMLWVCVCISRGNPLPQISWDLASVTDYSVINSNSTHTVNSILTLSASTYHNSTVKCISVNELGRTGKTIPLQKFPGLKKYEATVPWIIISVSLSLNLILLILIICIYKRAKSEKRKHYEETITYASLKKADVQEEYSVISPHPT